MNFDFKNEYRFIELFFFLSPFDFLLIFYEKELSGPMAETLRRLGETAGTGLDYAALQKALSVSLLQFFNSIL